MLGVSVATQIERYNYNSPSDTIVNYSTTSKKYKQYKMYVLFVDN